MLGHGDHTLRVLWRVLVAWAASWAWPWADWVGPSPPRHSGPWAIVGPLEHFILAIVQMDF
jgi:hypothetical protein